MAERRKNGNTEEKSKETDNISFFKSLAEKLGMGRTNKMNMEEKEVLGKNDIPVEGLETNTDENAAGDVLLNEPLQEASSTEKVETELAEMKDKYIRLMAEFENYKRRTAKERMELIQTAGKDIVVSLLDVLDDCDRAEKQLNSNLDLAVQKEGIQLVFNKIRSTLQAKGVKAMESINTDFDVEKHEAITEIPAPSDELKGKVLDEVMKGYYLNDKIVRFAKVVVGN